MEMGNQTLMKGARSASREGRANLEEISRVHVKCD